MGLDAMILVFRMLSFKPAFSLISFTFIKRHFSSSSLSAIRVVSTMLPFCISFSWRWSWSLPSVQRHKPPSIVLQAFCLSNLFPWIYLSLPQYNHKGFDLGHTWIWSSGFPYFLQFKSEFCNKDFMTWVSHVASHDNQDNKTETQITNIWSGKRLSALISWI